jgi:D-alanine-D-alanine ligase
MNITLLLYLEPDSPEHDKSIHQIEAALESAGHKTSIFGVRGDLSKMISGLRRRKPDLVFNLLEQFNDTMLGLVEATAVIELLGIPYTGGGPGELYLQEDKALSKKLLAYEKLMYPDFAVFSTEADLETGGNLRMPLFVKPLRMDSSIGIEGSKSLVRNTMALMEQVMRIHRDLKDAALCEEYIEGREFYVGVLGNQDPIAFPPIEIDFSKMPENAPHVLDGKAKFDESSPEYKGTKPIVADVDDQLRARLQQTALDACRALRVRDYGRVDLRVAETGDIYIIEVNANCYLEQESEFAMAAAAAGIEYPELISRIVEHAIDRRKRAAQTPWRKRSKRAAPREKAAAGG